MELDRPFIVFKDPNEPIDVIEPIAEFWEM